MVLSRAEVFEECRFRDAEVVSKVLNVPQRPPCALPTSFFCLNVVFERDLSALCCALRPPDASCAPVADVTYNSTILLAQDRRFIIRSLYIVHNPLV